jgi:hypothetical protein
MNEQSNCLRPRGHYGGEIAVEPHGTLGALLEKGPMNEGE